MESCQIAWCWLRKIDSFNPPLKRHETRSVIWQTSCALQALQRERNFLSRTHVLLPYFAARLKQSIFSVLYSDFSLSKPGTNGVPQLPGVLKNATQDPYQPLPSTQEPL